MGRKSAGAIILKRCKKCAAPYAQQLFHDIPRPVLSTTQYLVDVTSSPDDDEQLSFTPLARLALLFVLLFSILLLGTSQRLLC